MHQQSEHSKLHPIQKYKTTTQIFFAVIVNIIDNMSKILISSCFKLNAKFYNFTVILLQLQFQKSAPKAHVIKSIAPKVT